MDQWNIHHVRSYISLSLQSTRDSYEIHVVMILLTLLMNIMWSWTLPRMIPVVGKSYKGICSKALINIRWDNITFMLWMGYKVANVSMFYYGRKGKTLSGVGGQNMHPPCLGGTCSFPSPTLNVTTNTSTIATPNAQTRLPSQPFDQRMLKLDEANAANNTSWHLSHSSSSMVKVNDRCSGTK